MAMQVFPTDYEIGAAFTIEAVFRAAKLPAAPNMNMLPPKRSFKDLQKPAARQIVRLVKLIRKSRALRMIKQSKYQTIVQSHLLFPQLGFYPKKDVKLTLTDIFGPYVNAVAKALARLPRKKIIFGLYPDDDWCDAALFQELSLHPKLKHHAFILCRPIHSKWVIKATPTKAVEKKNKKSKKKPEQRRSALVQCTFDDFRNYKRKKKQYARLREIRKERGFLIFD